MSGRSFTTEESRRIVSEMSVLARLRECSVEEMLLVWELIPGILAAVRSRPEAGLKLALFSADECRLLVDALVREPGSQAGELRASLLTALSGKLQKTEV
jgi:hypothetical protein